MSLPAIAVTAVTIAALWSVSRYPQMPRSIFAYLASQTACTAVSTVTLRGMNPASPEYLWLYFFPVTAVAIMALWAATRLTQLRGVWIILSLSAPLTFYFYLAKIYWAGVPPALWVLLIQAAILSLAGITMLLADSKDWSVRFTMNVLGSLWLFQAVYKLGYSVGIVVDREFWRWTAQWFPTFLILAAYSFLILWMEGAVGKLRNTWFGVPAYHPMNTALYRKGH